MQMYYINKFFDIMIEIINIIYQSEANNENIIYFIKFYVYIKLLC